MKILVRKLWFKYSVEDSMVALFKIPQFRTLFEEGWVYDREMRIKGARIFPGYWEANSILEKLTYSKGAVNLVLTSLDLKGKYGIIHGMGDHRGALVSSDGFIDRFGEFDSYSPGFVSTAFGEIGHALGLNHHGFDASNPCEMSHNERPGPKWSSLDQVHFCNDCYNSIGNFLTGFHLE